MILTVDLETYSPQDIGKVGAYRYAQDPDFEILLASAAVDEEPVWLADLTQLDRLADATAWSRMQKMLFDPRYTKRAWNAALNGGA